MNSSRVWYPSQTPFGSAFFGLFLYLIVQPTVGDNERGDPDASDDVSLATEFDRETSVESIRLNKSRDLFNILEFDLT